MGTPQSLKYTTRADGTLYGARKPGIGAVVRVLHVAAAGLAVAAPGRQHHGETLAHEVARGGLIPHALVLGAPGRVPTMADDDQREGARPRGAIGRHDQLAVELPQTEVARRALIQQRVSACTGSAIVYCATVREATALHRQLSGLEGLAGEVGLYHGKLPARERAAAEVVSALG